MSKKEKLENLAVFIGLRAAHEILIKLTNKPESTAHLDTEADNYTDLSIELSKGNWNDEDIEKTRQLLLGLVDVDPEYLKEPAPRVIVTALNDYNITLELQAWLKDERQHVEKRSELREKVFEVLNRAGVDMPFQIIQLAPVQVNMAN